MNLLTSRYKNYSGPVFIGLHNYALKNPILCEEEPGIAGHRRKNGATSRHGRGSIAAETYEISVVRNLQNPLKVPSDGAHPARADRETQDVSRIES